MCLITHDEDLWMIGKGKIGSHVHPALAIQLASESEVERRRLDAGRPKRRSGLDAFPVDFDAWPPVLE